MAKDTPHERIIKRCCEEAGYSDLWNILEAADVSVVVICMLVPQHLGHTS